MNKIIPIVILVYIYVVAVLFPIRAYATNESSYKLGYIDAIQTMRCALVKGSCSTTDHSYSNAVTNETAYNDGWRNAWDHLQHNPIQYGYINGMKDGKGNVRDSTDACGDTTNDYNACIHGYNLGFKKGCDIEATQPSPANPEQATCQEYFDYLHSHHLHEPLWVDNDTIH